MNVDFFDLVIMCVVALGIGIFIGRIITDTINSGGIVMVRENRYTSNSMPLKSHKPNPDIVKYIIQPGQQPLMYYGDLTELNLCELELKGINSVPTLIYQGKELKNFESIIYKYGMDENGGSINTLEINYFDSDKKMKIKTSTIF